MGIARILMGSLSWSSLARLRGPRPYEWFRCSRRPPPFVRRRDCSRFCATRWSSLIRVRSTHMLKPWSASYMDRGCDHSAASHSAEESGMASSTRPTPTTIPWWRTSTMDPTRSHQWVNGRRITADPFWPAHRRYSGAEPSPASSRESSQLLSDGPVQGAAKLLAWT